jgi:nicotinamidase/pyrazinamidase
MTTQTGSPANEGAGAPGHRRVPLGTQLGLRAGDALMVVDVQWDFLPGGSLGVLGGDAVIPQLNACMAAFDARDLPVFLTRDWHPQDHCSFRAQGGPWPVHCVQDSRGAQWPPELLIPQRARIISKATDRNVEAYSAFSGTSLLIMLRELGVQRLFIGGLATDYCVHDTVLDARNHGFEVVVLTDAIRAVNVNAGDDTRALTEMAENGAILLSAAGRQGS